jgi:signal transduction histidine kinase
MGRRFTTAQVEDAKAGAREDERARLAREVIKPLNTRMSQIHAAVLGTELARELEQYRSAHAATLLVEALGEVRRITGVTSV